MRYWKEGLRDALLDNAKRSFEKSVSFWSRVGCASRAHQARGPAGDPKASSTAEFDIGLGCLMRNVDRVLSNEI